MGANKFNFGNRNAPTITYMKYSKPLELKTEEGETSYEGGFFWDGRANSLEEQAKGPFLNPIEMASTQEYVVSGICNSNTYGTLFKSIFGDSACDQMMSFGLPSSLQFIRQLEKAFDGIATALASFERTDKFSAFTSKFDKVIAGQDSFTESELRGYNQFKNPKTANCIGCHVLETDNESGKALFTDFSYDNLGVPTNPELVSLGHSAPDMGLSQTTQREEDRGKFKVPTLRNIALTAPYMHNGYFKTLKQVVEFYNDRDVKPACNKILSADEAEINGCWPTAEITETVNHKELGDLKLSEQDILDLVAFMQTLSDDYLNTNAR